MNLREYIKERWLQFIMLLAVLTVVILFGVLVMIPNFYLLLVGVSFVSIWFAVWCTDYMRKRRFYRTVENHLAHLDQKYLLPELLECPGFLEGKFMYETLQEMAESMNWRVGEYRHKSDEYKEYIELWVHEVKLPIATGKMILENNRDSCSESLSEELDKIDDFAEQALFYARSNYVEKDYILKKLNLEELAREVIRKNKKALIGGKFSIALHDLNVCVYSDSKWLAFILNQILANSIKYRKEDSAGIEWYAAAEKEKVILCMKDKGIGIPVMDVGRVFDKGFTGSNGRFGKKSTGIGLYLCRKLCEKMGHKIYLTSREGEGCEVFIEFPKGSMTGFLE